MIFAENNAYRRHPRRRELEASCPMDVELAIGLRQRICLTLRSRASGLPAPPLITAIPTATNAAQCLRSEPLSAVRLPD